MFEIEYSSYEVIRAPTSSFSNLEPWSKQRDAHTRCSERIPVQHWARGVYLITAAEALYVLAAFVFFFGGGGSC